MPTEYEAEGMGEMPRRMDLEMAKEQAVQGANIATLQSEVAALRRDVAEIKEMLATNRGGVRMLLSVGGVAASLGAAVASLVAEWIRWLHSGG